VNAAPAGLRPWFENYLAAFNRADFAAFGACYADDVIFHGQAAQVVGRNAVLDFYRKVRGYLDERVDLLDFVAAPDGTRIAAELRTTLVAVRDHMGGLAATRDFARMFLVPGGYHCAGGYIAYDQDFLGAVVNWVELGKAPDAIEASATLADGLVRRRALYPYPTRTRYLGGDMNAAASFAPIAVRDAPEDGFDWPGSHAISKQRRNLAPRD
jgi:feruloyl esterase